MEGDRTMELRALHSWYTSRDGWVSLDDDVLSIVRQVKEAYGDRVTIELDRQFGHYAFVEHCEDDTDRLVFTTTELDGRCLERLMMGDSQSRVYQDPYDAAEREQDDAQRDIDKAHNARIGDAGEHLAHVFKKTGVEPRLPLAKSMYIPEAEDADSDG
jgi:hypothetical protein